VTPHPREPVGEQEEKALSESKQLRDALDEIRDEAYAHMDETQPEDSALNRSLMALARIAEAAIAKAEAPRA
jgi:hypothetical protein